jgi:hypothetical protein
LFVTNMTKLLHHRSYPQQSLTDKQASLSTSYLASIPGLYSYMRAPPFQDTWNVTLGGSAQDLRGEKISARGCGLLGRCVPSVQLIRKMTRGHTSRKSAKSARGVPISLAQAKKSPDSVEAFRLRAMISLHRPQ